MSWIDSKEIAKLLCITLQAVNKDAKEGKYGDKIRYIKGRGRSGRTLQIALEALPEEMQRKWQSNKENAYVQLSLPLDNYSTKKRTASDNKLMIINEYRDFIANSLAKQLHIITHYSIPYNAKAKPIERFFRTFEEQFGKLFMIYISINTIAWHHIVAAAWTENHPMRFTMKTLLKKSCTERSIKAVYDENDKSFKGAKEWGKALW